MPTKENWIQAIKNKIAEYNSTRPTAGDSSTCPFCLLSLDKEMSFLNCCQCIMSSETYPAGEYNPCIHMQTYPHSEFGSYPQRKQFWEEALPIMEELPDERFTEMVTRDEDTEITAFPELWELDAKIHKQYE